MIASVLPVGERALDLVPYVIFAGFIGVWAFVAVIGALDFAQRRRAKHRG